MSWVEAIPALIVAGVWLLAPGVLTSYVLGMRGLAAWAVSPAISTALVALSAVVAGRGGLAWSPLVAASLAALPALVVLAVRALRGHALTATVAPDPFRTRFAGWLGMVPAVVIGTVIVARGFRSPDNMSQTYDAVFHYNALRWIIASDNGSSLTLGGLGPRSQSSFYPGAWHDFASLLIMSTGSSVVVAANVLTAAIAVLAWPLACLFLTRQVLGPSLPGLAVTGLLSVSFTAFPWGLLSFGVLWPNVLGFALMPVGLAAGLSILGMANHDALTRGRAWFVLVATLVATGLAQPNATFGLAALLLFPTLFALVGWMQDRLREGRITRAFLGTSGAIAAATLAWIVVHSLEKIMAVKAFDGWRAFRSVPGAVGEALLNAPNGREPLWLLSIAVVTGMFLAFRNRTTSWLPFAHAWIAALYVLTAAVQTSASYVLTGFWYNDSHRLAAMVPVTGVALAAGGVAWGGAKLRDRVTEWDLPGRLRNRIPSSAAASAVFGVVLLLVTVFSYQGLAVDNINAHYNATGHPKNTLVEAAERKFYTRVDAIVADDVVVAANPWSGAAMLWALTGTRVLFPQLSSNAREPAQKYLAMHLNEAASDPKVCRLLDRFNVRYLLVGTQRFWLRHSGNQDYPGLAYPEFHRGFQLVTQQGNKLKLFRITACDNSLATRTPAPDHER